MQALEMARHFHGENHELVISCYNNLGAGYQEQSQLAQSEPFRRKALAMARDMYGLEHPTTARLTLNLGKLLQANGDVEGAEALYREALDMRRRLLGDDHPDTAFGLLLVGDILKNQGRYDEAEPYLWEALEMRKRVLGEEHPHVAWTIGSLASLNSRRGRHEEALRLKKDQLELRRRIHGDAHPEVYRTVRGIAGTYIELGDYDEAERWIDDAYTLLDDPALATFSTRWLLGLRSRIALARGDLERAEALYTEMMEDFERSRLVRSGFANRAKFTASDTPYQHLAAVRLLQGKDDEAWPAVERYLGRGMFDLLLKIGERPLTASETAREDSLNSVLTDLEKRYAVLSNESNNGTPSAVAEKGEAVRTRLLATEAAWGTFREDMRRKYPLAEDETFPLERVQSALDDHSALIGWLDIELTADENVAWAYVIRSQGPVCWVKLSLGDDPLQDAPREFREALVGAASWPYRVTSVTKIDWMAEDLYRQRLSPVARYLDGVTDLFVVSSGAMQGVPLEALIDEDTQCAGDRFTVSYVSSGTVYAWMREHAPPRAAGTQHALVVGDPALPAAGASSFDRAVVLSGERASEQEVVALAHRLDRFDVIHMATHAAVDAQRPERSYLTLSQRGLPDPLASAMAGERIYDGKLTVHEIVREWKLDADLVTLSACRTALGRESRGEGFVGFAHAFLQTGARSVVVSLWEVDDEATSRLMGRFYENLTGHSNGEPMSKAAALREAKHWLREYTDDAGRTPFRHPAYWSGFILVGDSG
jgi:CHAT domain-containing protein